MSAARVTTYRRYVAANVRKLRQKLGLTQEDLVGRVDGLAVRTLQAVEVARANVSLSLLVTLAEALEVEPGRLLRRARFEQTRPGRPAATRKR